MMTGVDLVVNWMDWTGLASIEIEFVALRDDLMSMFWRKIWAGI